MLEKELQKRIRIFAGPNGSGKSTLYRKIKDEFNLRFGHYLNADQINDVLQKNSFIDIDRYEIKADFDSFTKFIINSGWNNYVKDNGYLSKWKISGNIIAINKDKLKSYDSAILTDYIRNRLLKRGKTFTFETVMSHPSKIKFIADAAKKGYKVYLYFIATDDLQINLNRVKLRVKKGGHHVAPSKIRKRYLNTLKLLKSAALSCYRTYLFDNTKSMELVLSINPQKEIKFEKNEIPLWVDKYLLK